VTLAGLYFFHPKCFTGHFKMSEFTSTLAITGLYRPDPKRRDISLKTKNSYFVCDHRDEAVADIVAACEALFLTSVDPTAIRLGTFFRRSAASPPNLCVDEDNISQIRCVYHCARHGVPVNDTFLDVFQRLDPEASPTIFLDDTVEVPAHLACLVNPINAIGKFLAVPFKAYTPFTVCRLANHFLKHSATIPTLIFEGHCHMMVTQLRMGRLKLRDTEPLSLIILKLSCVFAGLEP
jgi:hypothetical protein